MVINCNCKNCSRSLVIDGEKVHFSDKLLEIEQDLTRENIEIVSTGCVWIDDKWSMYLSQRDVAKAKKAGFKITQ